ncbi:MAG TPA: hypothetical protein VFG84_01070 [Gemmatimonadaceae bacterium]|nr:hypothetical protein [Gemmatimonadaceae bacterium]
MRYQLVSTALAPPRCVFAVFTALLLFTRGAAAQTDYYNTDAGRPITIEDAYAIEYRAIELQLAPLRLERGEGAAYRWGLEPELALGLFPRTQVELAFPIAWIDRGAGGNASTAGLAGIELSVLHNLNVETSIPAFALAADLIVPAGSLAPERAYPSLKGIATKTFTWARIHLNARYTFGDRAEPATAVDEAHADGELSRWLAGIALDRTLPLRSLLFTGEVVAREPLAVDDRLQWSTAAGVRYQLSPRVATDAGAGYRLSGGDKGWFLTFGAAFSVGMPWGIDR